MSDMGNQEGFMPKIVRLLVLTLSLLLTSTVPVLAAQDGGYSAAPEPPTTPPQPVNRCIDGNGVYLQPGSPVVYSMTGRVEYSGTDFWSAPAFQGRFRIEEDQDSSIFYVRVEGQDREYRIIARGRAADRISHADVAGLAVTVRAEACTVNEYGTTFLSRIRHVGF